MAILKDVFIKEINQDLDINKSNKKLEKMAIAEQIKLEADFIKEILVKYAKYLKERGKDYTEVKQEVNRVLNIAIEKYNIGTASFVKEINKKVLSLFMISKDAKESIMNKLNIDNDMFENMKKKHSLLFESVDATFKSLM